MSFEQVINLFKQDNNSFKRLIMSFEQVILSCLNKIKTLLNDLLSVSQLTETSRNVPKRTSVGTETDFTVYRNGAECDFSSHRNEYNGYQKRKARYWSKTSVCVWLR